MGNTISVVKKLTLAFVILSFLFLINGNSVAEETESNPIPVHLNLKEAAKLSPETSSDLERVALEAVSYTHLTLPTKRIV